MSLPALITVRAYVSCFDATLVTLCCVMRVQEGGLMSESSKPLRVAIRAWSQQARMAFPWSLPGDSLDCCCLPSLLPCPYPVVTPAQGPQVLQAVVSRVAYMVNLDVLHRPACAAMEDPSAGLVSGFHRGDSGRPIHRTGC